MKKILSILIVIAIIGLGTWYFLGFFNKDIDIIPDDKSNLIVVSAPIKDSEISSPLTISGRARGVWYFEGSFPVTLVDQYRNTIAEGYVTAQGEWMTENFVPFIGDLQFNNYIKGAKGTLILKKDNPSGLPEHDDSIEIPVQFK